MLFYVVFNVVSCRKYNCLRRTIKLPLFSSGRVRLKPDGTRRRTVGVVKGKRRMEWVASTLTLPWNVVYPALVTLMRTSRLPAFDWTDAPADSNGLVHFGEGRNLVSARVPSRFKRTIPQDSTDKEYSYLCLINHHEIKGYRGLKVQLHSLTSTPDGAGYSSPTLFASPLQKEPSVLTV
jgi:hypothetical protein